MKHVRTALILLVVLGLLAGCDTTPSPTPSPASTATPAQATPTVQAQEPLYLADRKSVV